MTGLNLELFLRLLRIDVAAWASLAIVLVILALLAWTSWGSRKALRKCLFASIAMHVGLVLYGGTLPLVRNLVRPIGDAPAPKPVEHIKKIELVKGRLDAGGLVDAADGAVRSGRSKPFDGPSGTASFVEAATIAPPKRDPVDSVPSRDKADLSASAPDAKTPALPTERPRSGLESRESKVAIETPRMQPIADPGAIAESSGSASREGSKTEKASAKLAGGAARSEPVREPSIPLPETDLRRAAESLRERPKSESTVEPKRGVVERTAIARVTPKDFGSAGDRSLAPGGRPVTDVPEVYRPRLDPNRSAVARRAGANHASEQAVERALDWLARHQDADGRWNGGSVQRGATATPCQAIRLHRTIAPQARFAPGPAFTPRPIPQ